ncbi:MAG: copper-binding protein [Alphaproteobacteria bacterium]
MGSGVITAIDPISYTVTISHGPIAAINWPAMTMTFTAQDPAILKGLAVGDHVSFQLKSVSEPGTVIAIHKQ